MALDLSGLAGSLGGLFTSALGGGALSGIIPSVLQLGASILTKPKSSTVTSTLQGLMAEAQQSYQVPQIQYTPPQYGYQQVAPPGYTPAYGGYGYGTQYGYGAYGYPTYPYYYPSTTYGYGQQYSTPYIPTYYTTPAPEDTGPQINILFPSQGDEITEEERLGLPPEPQVISHEAVQVAGQLLGGGYKPYEAIAVGLAPTGGEPWTYELAEYAKEFEEKTGRQISLLRDIPWTFKSKPGGG